MTNKYLQKALDLAKELTLKERKIEEEKRNKELATKEKKQHTYNSIAHSLSCFNGKILKNSRYLKIDTSAPETFTISIYSELETRTFLKSIVIDENTDTEKTLDGFVEFIAPYLKVNI